MKTKNLSNMNSRSPERFGDHSLQFRRPILTLLAISVILLAASASRAATLTWDADVATAGAQNGSGSWFTNSLNGSTTNWWNGSANVAGTWTGATPDLAVFGNGSGVAGAYGINLDAAVVASTLVFNSPGNYTITNNPGIGNFGMNLNTANNGAIDVTFSIMMSNSVSALINVPLTSGGADIRVGTNSVLTLAGGLTAGGNPRYNGVSTDPTVSTINFTNGTYTANPSSTIAVNGVTLNITGSAIFNAPARFDLARDRAATVSVGSGGQLNENTSNGSNAGNNLQLSRGQISTLNILPGGLVSTVLNNTAGKVLLIPDSSSRATLNMSGGTLNVGTGAGGTPGANGSLTLITLAAGGMTYSATASAIMNISGGTVTAQGIQIGSASGTYTSSPTNKLNITGGTVYLGAPNISVPKNTGTNHAINLSGGTIAALSTWSPASTAPMNLTNVNGDITFQAADAVGSSFDIALSGPLTGVGGLKKTGVGMLTLSGANNYAGTTVVSNGTLKVGTALLPTNGPVILSGLTGGTPVSSVRVDNTAQYWKINGDLTYAAGSTLTADFDYLGNQPSITVAPIQVNGNVVFTVTPLVTVEGNFIPSGTYPLIKYTGTLSGTPPTGIVSLFNGATSVTLVNNTANKSIDMVVVSTLPSSLKWAVGNGNWDFVTPNWNQNGTPVAYADGKSVIFEDAASGTSPITVNLVSSVNPGNVSVNATKTYAISGTGAITGPNGLIKAGNGTLTLSGTNTYSGGTTVSGGQLNINYGGDGINNSAIGIGPLTNILGAKIDNTSGQLVTLATPIAQYWNDDWTFVGSTNLTIGAAGNVTLGSGLVVVTVSSNTLAVDAPIVDAGLGYGLGKAGSGALTLSNFNSFSGGMQLNAGTLNINNNQAVGSGTFTINGGAVDNTSGADVTLTAPGIVNWDGSFVFKGTTNFTFANTLINVANVTLTVSKNTLFVGGGFVGANRTLTKDGPGALTLIGGNPNASLSFVINGGTMNFSKDFGAFSQNNNSVTVNTNGTLVMLNPVSSQMTLNTPLILGGGTIEMNGDTEPCVSLTFNSGILRNGASSTTSALNPVNGVSLVGTNCIFDVTNDATLVITKAITNSGSLNKTGAGLLNLAGTNNYTGGTVITAGTLALVVDAVSGSAGSISNSAVINIGSGATLDVIGRADQTLTLNNGQTLRGNGSINGSLVTLPGSTVAPGASVGTLRVTNNITLGGTLLMELDKANSQTNDKLVSVTGTITYGGTLVVTNIGSTLQAGDTFQLFPGAATFGSVNLATTDAGGNVYAWNNNVGVNGSITVATVTPAINPNPGPIQFSASPSTLSLAWPTNGGWILQTNATSLVDTNAWFVYPGSTALTNVNIPINNSKTNVFFRLVKP
ncbi:MAG: Autotransporter-associated beta strand repeat protein [Pedosphaera sp.]|nr:Autotransporter-associated beta strand repeat protein [Pedosphaera sp.]